jgi:hypothetical protein
MYSIGGKTRGKKLQYQVRKEEVISIIIPGKVRDEEVGEERE